MKHRSEGGSGAPQAVADVLSQWGLDRVAWMSHSRRHALSLCLSAEVPAPKVCTCMHVTLYFTLSLLYLSHASSMFNVVAFYLHITLEVRTKYCHSHVNGCDKLALLNLLFRIATSSANRLARIDLLRSKRLRKINYCPIIFSNPCMAVSRISNLLLRLQLP